MFRCFSFDWSLSQSLLTKCTLRVKSSESGGDGSATGELLAISWWAWNEGKSRQQAGGDNPGI
jgi:hypothetical protein